MKKKKGFVLREVCGEKVLMGEGLEAIDFGNLVCLNDTAAWLWEQSGDEFTTDDLVNKLCSEYDVELARARDDVDSTIHKWHEIGLVE